MDDGLFLQTAEGLRDPSFKRTDGEIWNELQDLKEKVSQDMLEEGPLCQSEAGGLRENGPSAGNGDIEWSRRARLEARLSDIIDAPDRLLDGRYGDCIESGKQLHPGRLAADPAAALCVDCQRIADGEQVFRTM